jgi:glyoxylase-like metal-dependent hydrolase (beta-lactamase superfamily II)
MRLVTDHVADGVYRLGTRWVNFYVVVDGSEAILVDAGYPGYVERITTLLDRISLVAEHAGSPGVPVPGAHDRGRRRHATGRPGLALHRFNEDRARAAESLTRLAGLDAEVVLFGHGDPWPGTPRSAVESIDAGSA